MNFEDFNLCLQKKVVANKYGKILASIRRRSKSIRIEEEQFKDLKLLSEEYDIPLKDIIWLVLYYGFEQAKHKIAVTDYEYNPF